MIRVTCYQSRLFSVYIMLHVDINKLHVNIIMLHVDIIYLACKGQKYATIANIKIKITRQKFSLYYKELWRITMQGDEVGMTH